MRLSPLLQAVSTSIILTQQAVASMGDQTKALPPSKDSFYAVPRNVSDLQPGQIIRHRRPPSSFSAYDYEPTIIKEAHQLLYRTSDNIDNATATVLTVFVPKDANMSRIVSYQVAEDAASVDCAPSFGFQSAVSSHKSLISDTMKLQLLIIQSALERGWVVIVPDFQGPLGAYAANRLAGSAVLDGIRAAMQSESLTGIHPEAKAVLWGYSGGATVTQFAAEMQPIYAPELKLAGAAIGGLGPADDSLDVVLEFNKNPRTGLLVSAMVGLSSQYDRYRKALNDYLDPRYREKFYSPLHQCLEANLATFHNEDVLSMFSDVGKLLTDPVLEQIGVDNTRGTTTPRTPMLWYQCTRDDIADIKDVDASFDDYCARGAVINYIRDTAPNLAHRNYGVVGASDALAWIEDRFESRSEERKCSKKTVNTPDIDPDFLGLFPKHIRDALTKLASTPPKT
jgi:hypothetical protein